MSGFKSLGGSIFSSISSKKLTALIGKDSTFKFFGLNKFKHDEYYELAYLLSARKNLDQPINTPSDQFTEFNYGSIVYCKSAIVFDYLMNSVGTDKFDAAMRFYFEHWRYKHPTPLDLQKTLYGILSLSYSKSQCVDWHCV